MFLTDLFRAPASGLPAALAPRRLALTVAGVIAFSLWINIVVPFLGARDIVGILAPLVSMAGVAVSFRWWRVGLGLSALAPVVASALDRDPTGTGILAILIAFLLALRGASPVLVGTVVAVANLVAALSYFGLDGSAGRWPSVVIIGAVLTAAVGAAVRSRAEVRDGQEQHRRDAASNHELTVKNAVAEERVRIARDLHDSIGHGIAVISMHVGAAQMAAMDADAEVNTSLTAARTAIKSVLEETQHTLQLLRVDTGDSSIAPITHPEALTSLILSYQSLGLEVDSTIEEPIDQLPDRVNVTIYRIVQEMLTNAHRHSTGAMTLVISRAGTVMTVRARNQRRQPVRPVGGHGLVGMRERAESLRGSIHVIADDHWFDVAATVQLPHAKVSD